MRLATDLAEDHTGKLMNAEGQNTEKNVWGKRSPWVDYYGQVDGKTVGVAIMDHRSNPRHPTYWHSRAYGPFAANPFGVSGFTGDKSKDGSLTMGPGQRLSFLYRVVIHPGMFGVAISRRCTASTRPSGDGTSTAPGSVPGTYRTVLATFQIGSFIPVLADKSVYRRESTVLERAFS